MESLKPMNNIEKILLQILFYSLFFSTIISQECTSTLKINLENNSVGFLQDSIKIENNSEYNLKVGVYPIKIKSLKNIWDEKIFSDTIKINECNKKYFFTNSSKEIINLQTEPADAVVLHSNKQLGLTPLIINDDCNIFEIRKEGYKTIFVKRDEISNSIFRLEKIQLENSESFFKTNLFKILIGGAVVLGTVAAYFKIDADKSYEQYQITGDENFLTQTRRKDLISGISFGLMQLNFGFLIYNFLIK